MFNILKEVRILRDEDKLHQKLVNRVRVLFAISAIILAIVLFNVVYRGADWPIVLILVAAGFIIGLFIFSRMSVIQWNEETETVEAGRMDAIGYAVLVLYIAIEIGLRTFLTDFFPLHATVFLLAGVGGGLLGRAVGTVVEIHRVFRATHGA